MTRFVKVFAFVVCASVGVAATAQAKDYVLTSKGTLGTAQIAAVWNAGGTVNYSHAGTGLVMASSDAADFAAKLAASDAFAQVAEDMMVRWVPDLKTIDFHGDAIDPSNDTYYPIQWAPGAIGAPAAWTAGCTGQGVRVAVIDGGIYDAHLDLAGAVDVAASRSFVPGQPFNFDQRVDPLTGNLVPDTFWHGTHVAGIIAARDNARGVVGIAPEATIVGVKALHAGSGEFGWVISAILYADTPLAQGGGGADIINMSLGALFPRGGGNTGAGPLVAALNKAVNYANRFGVLVVSSAGNDAVDLDHSASWISVPAQSGAGIAVAATGPVGWALPLPGGPDSNNFSRLASYSNFGTSAIHVSAPGGDAAYPTNENCVKFTAGGSPIVVPCWVFDMVMSTSRGSSAAGGYSWAAGTSMAAPATSAVAALIKGDDPSISLGALKARLAQTADDVYKPGADPQSGKGFVNAYRACVAR
jgi:subtilisin family serine protease